MKNDESNQYESRIDKARDIYEVITIKLKRQMSWVYKSVAWIIVSFYVFVFAFSVFVPVDEVKYETKIGSNFMINSETYTLVDVKYNQKKGLVEFDIVQDAGYKNEFVTLDFKVEFKGVKENDSSLKIIKGERGYTTVFVENVPNEWNQMRLVVEVNENQSSYVYALRETIILDDSLVVRNDVEIDIQSIEYQIQLKRDYLNSTAEKVETLKSDQEKLKNDILDIQEEMVYLTSKEIVSAENQIETLEKSIEDKSKEIENIETTNKEYIESIAKMELKIDDLEGKNTGTK